MRPFCLSDGRETNPSHGSKIGLALPSRRTDKLIFIQELMSKEKFQYGVYTEGNWRSVLDDEEDRRERKQG